MPESPQWEYHYRWDQIIDAGVENSIDILEERDREIEFLLFLGFNGCFSDFQYQYRWPYMADLPEAEMIAALQERDKDFEAVIDSFGCTFEYPYKWEQIWPLVLEGNPLGATLAEENDRAFEAKVRNCSCGVAFCSTITMNDGWTANTSLNESEVFNVSDDGEIVSGTEMSGFGLYIYYTLDDFSNVKDYDNGTVTFIMAMGFGDDEVQLAYTDPVSVTSGDWSTNWNTTGETFLSGENMIVYSVVTDLVPPAGVVIDAVASSDSGTDDVVWETTAEFEFCQEFLWEVPV